MPNVIHGLRCCSFMCNTLHVLTRMLVYKYIMNWYVNISITQQRKQNPSFYHREKLLQYSLVQPTFGKGAGEGRRNRWKTSKCKFQVLFTMHIIIKIRVLEKLANFLTFQPNIWTGHLGGGGLIWEKWRWVFIFLCDKESTQHHSLFY